MKKNAVMVLMAGILLALAGCSNPSSSGSPDTGPEDKPKTYVRLINPNVFPVSLYSDFSHLTLIARIGARESSIALERDANPQGAQFFPVYHISLEGVEFPYDGTAFIARIDAGTTTDIPIPNLSEVPETDRARPLVGNAYLKVQNAGASSLTLRRGSTEIRPEGMQSTILNGGETGLYVVSPGPVSSYSFRKNTVEQVDFPAGITEFTAGHFYSFQFNGAALIVVADRILTIDEALNEAENDDPGQQNIAPAMPAVIAGDGFITISWNTTAGAVGYEVYYGTGNTPPAVPAKTVQTATTVINGLANKTIYYVWVKAVYAAEKSDYSPMAQGTPWPGLERPEVPGALRIISGVEQLTINWDESGGAAFYDVYINVNPSPPSAYRLRVTEASAVLNALANGTIYYIWVKAGNSSGTSGFSPMEAGTPSLPLSPPAVPAAPVVIPGSGELSVQWLPVEMATAYEVWAGTSNNPSSAIKQGADIPASGELGTTITGLINGTVYSVWIRAKNNVGTSGFSLRSMGTPSAFAAAPAAPDGPVLTAGYSMLTLTWAPVEGALYYEVLIGVSPSITNAHTYQDAVDSVSLTINGLTNGTRYYAWVIAKNSAGTSGPSPAASEAPSVYLAVPETPGTPVINTGNTQLLVSWNAAPGAEEYEVYYGTGTPSTLWGTVSETSARISGLTNGTAYTVRIRSKNRTGVSDWSGTASGIPSGAGILSVVVGFNYGQITITGNSGNNGISKSSADGMSGSLSLSAVGYTNVVWYADGDTTQPITGGSITLDAANYDIQLHYITFTGNRNGVLYSREINFTVFD
ncbi:fibronectin type III domain-containing protein [Leadbettera azotonutricia]|nr:fibronectin type III domain-containing protein [Leadbettera azotonutricia]